MKLATYLLMTAGLSALGCPLLVDDHLEVVPADADDPNESVAGAAGAAPNEPAPMPGAAGAPACGVSSPPASSTACPPAVCDRCEAGQCIFECATQDVCKERVIACPEGLACKVECGAKACGKAVVVCPSSYDCDLECGDTDACKEARLQCSDGNCNVHCLADKACENATVTCGTAQCGAECLGPMPKPTLQCGSACPCEPC